MNHARKCAKPLLSLAEMANALWCLAAKLAEYVGVHRHSATTFEPSSSQGVDFGKNFQLRTGVRTGDAMSWLCNPLISLSYSLSIPPTGYAATPPPSKAQPKTSAGAHYVAHKFFGIFHFLDSKAAI